MSLLLVVMLVYVQGDLPVHCVKHQIVGRWTIEMGKSKLKGKVIGP